MGLVQAEVVEADVVVHNMAQDLQAVIQVVRDLTLAGEIQHGCHLQTRGAVVVVAVVVVVDLVVVDLVDMLDVMDRLMRNRWMILQRRWRR